MKQIILASNSPRRKALLSKTGLKFKVKASNFNEDKIKFKTPIEMVKKLSREKACIIAKKNPNAIVIAADTTVVIKGLIIGKPKSKKDAFKILSLLSGKWHEVITGFTIISNSKNITKCKTTKVKFKKLSKEEIDAYIKTGEPMDMAGGYAIQGRGGLFVDKIDGDYFNIVGLPINSVFTVLSKFGVKII